MRRVVLAGVVGLAVLLAPPVITSAECNPCDTASGHQVKFVDGDYETVISVSGQGFGGQVDVYLTPGSSVAGLRLLQRDQTGGGTTTYDVYSDGALYSSGSFVDTSGVKQWWSLSLPAEADHVHFTFPIGAFEQWVQVYEIEVLEADGFIPPGWSWDAIWAAFNAFLSGSFVGDFVLFGVAIMLAGTAGWAIRGVVIAVKQELTPWLSRNAAMGDMPRKPFEGDEGDYLPGWRGKLDHEDRRYRRDKRRIRRDKRRGGETWDFD